MFRSFLTAVLLLCASAAFAFAPCEPAYQTARMSLVKAHLPQGAQQKVLTKLVNAWRALNGTSSDAVTTALGQLDAAKQLLSTGSFKDISGETKAKIAADIDGFAGCIRSASLRVPVPVTVRVFSAPDVAAGAGLTVLVDGQQVGKTAADGTVAVTVPDGDHTATAVQALNFGGSTPFTAVPNVPAPVDVVMIAGGDYATAADVSIDEAVDSVVPRDFPSFTVRLLDIDAKTIRIKTVSALRMDVRGDMVDVASRFTVKPTGELVANDRDAFRTLLLNMYGPYQLQLRAVDQQGRTWAGSFTVDLGRFHANGNITTPSGVSSTGIPVLITNQRDGFSFWATTSGGSVSFPQLLPEGTYTISCDSVIAGARYFGLGAFVLNADGSFALNLKPAVVQVP